MMSPTGNMYQSPLEAYFVEQIRAKEEDEKKKKIATTPPPSWSDVLAVAALAPWIALAMGYGYIYLWNNFIDAVRQMH